MEAEPGACSAKDNDLEEIPQPSKKSRRSRRLIAESSDEHDGGSQQNTSMASGSNGNIAASELAPSTTPPTFGTFSNPRRTTCYLGSLLQALRSSASTHRVVASHTCTAECPAVCPLRLIQNSWQATESEGSVADLEMWEPWFLQKDVNFAEQHDSMEILTQIISDSPAVASALELAMGVKVRIVGGSHYQCGHTPPIPFDNVVMEPFLEVKAPPDEKTLSLSSLMLKNIAEEPVDRRAPACPICQLNPSSCKTSGIAKASELLIVSINRVITEVKRWPDGSVCSLTQRKNPAAIFPDEPLYVGPARYHLRAVVKHEGPSPNCGHYVCGVRTANPDEYIVYNDDHPVARMKSTSLDLAAGLRIAFYERVQECAPPLPPPHTPPSATAPTISVLSQAGEQEKISETERGMTEQHKAANSQAPSTPKRSKAASALAQCSPKRINIAKEFMAGESGADAVERDARALLQVFLSKGDARAFLRQLPMFVSETGAEAPLDDCNRSLESSIESLLQDSINSSAALETLQYFGDSACYPLVVLAHSCMLAHGFPPAFFIDTVYTIVGSLLNKELHVELGRYKSRSRHWMNGVAAAGQGKSPTVKPLIEILLKVLKSQSTLAPGSPNDMFHTCQSTTTAAAIEKVRSTLAYLLLHSDDAGRCVSIPFAQGGKTDRGEHADLTYFLDAAHGDEFSHQTCRDREKLFRKKVAHPSEPVPVPEQMCLKPTNVHVLWLMQELYFAKYWAQLAFHRPIGLVQRVLFSFSSKIKEKNVLWNGFLDEVVAPVLEDVFRIALKTFGPKAPGDVQGLKLTKRQTEVSADIEETLTLFAQRRRIGSTMRDAMPKAFYWLGTALLGNWVLSTCLESVFKSSDAATIRPSVGDGLYVTCVNFIHRRYLYGQSVVACGVAEELWLGVDTKEPARSDDTKEFLVRALRLHAGSTITVDSMLLCDIGSKRTMELGSPEEKQRCTQRLLQIFQVMIDLGLGVAITSATEGRMDGVRKYSTCSLSVKAKEWLRANRISMSLFGPVSLGYRHSVAADAASTSQTLVPRSMTEAATNRGHGNNNPAKQATLAARRQKSAQVLFADVLPLPLLDSKSWLARLKQRPEFESVRAHFTWPKAVQSVLLGTATCCEDASCPVEWSIEYCTAQCGVLPKQTLRIVQRGSHDHSSGVSNSGAIFSPQVLRLAETIVRSTISKDLTFANFQRQLEQEVHRQAMDLTVIPPSGKLKTWLKRAKAKKAADRWEVDIQAGSQGMAASISMRIADLQKDFTEKVDELVVLPASDRFTTCLVSEPRTLVIFGCKGMFKTLQWYAGERAHITVDTKMRTLKRQRGVVTVYLNVKDRLRNTTFHTAHGRVQGKALTTHCLPVLQAILSEECGLNHEDLFEALKYLWGQAHPRGPAFEDVFRQTSKDFAPGIEVARREKLAFTRPLDDFFHFMGKTSEMESRCNRESIAENGKRTKTNLGWARAVLYDIQNTATIDMLSELWSGYLRRLASMDEIVLARYYFHQYSDLKTVKELRAMNLSPRSQDLEAVLFFLSWSGGFSAFPGSNTGSLGGEAAHSPWQAQLQHLGSKWEVEDCLAFMQQLYTDKWEKMYDWKEERMSYSLIPEVEDANVVNGKLLAKLDRTTLYDCCEAAKTQQVSHTIAIDKNIFVVMARKSQGTLPDEATARSACSILLASGAQLRQQLLAVGILRAMDEEEERLLGVAYLQERDRCQSKRSSDLHAFCEALGIAEDGRCAEPLMSLSKFRAYFKDVVYVVRADPDLTSDTWPFLRCTCDPFSQYTTCEHRAFARTRPIPGMRDAPISSDNIPLPTTRGRKAGSFTTARGKATARVRGLGTANRKKRDARR